jgi:RNA polymerase sigma factor (sigma-70 family)
MTFQTATQSTDLDRTDNIRAAVDAAPGWGDVPMDSLVMLAKDGSEPAKLELIARCEAYIRGLVSEFRRGNGAAEPDLQQSAMLGFLAALADFVPDGRAEFTTFAYSRIRREMTEANRTASPVPVASSHHKRFFAAMRAADNDPAVARRWSALQKLSIAELETVAELSAENGPLAREIIDRRVDIYAQHEARGYVTTGRGKGAQSPVPEWDDYRNQAGRGLSGHEFDTIHAALTYESLDTTHGDDDGADDADRREPVAEPVTADPDAADPFTDVDNAIALGQLTRTLEPRDADVIRRHLNGETDRDIATALGVSRPRVVNIRRAAIARMRKLAAG